MVTRVSRCRHYPPIATRRSARPVDSVWAHPTERNMVSLSCSCRRHVTAGLVAMTLSSTAFAQVTPTKFQDEILLTGAGSAVSLGTSVAISGDTAFVGGPSVSLVEVFERIAGDWIRVDTLNGVSAFPSDGFGYVAASVGRVAVGAPNMGAGTAYVYERVAGVWAQIGNVDASDPEPLGNFGRSIALSGNRLLVGEPNDDNANGVDAGAAHLYEYDGSAWNHVAKLIPSSGTDFGFAGAGVSIRGDVAVVAASGGPIAGPGRVHVFERVAGSWAETAELTSPLLAGANLAVSSAVDVHDSTILVGAKGSPSSSPGAVLVFERIAGVWTEVATLTTDESATQPADFGRDVALSGQFAVVGGLRELGTGVPFTVVFNREGGTWTQGVRLEQRFASGVSSMTAIDLDGDDVVIGSTTTNVRGFVFDMRGVPFGEPCGSGSSEAPWHDVVGHPDVGSELDYTVMGGPSGALGLLFVNLATADGLAVKGCPFYLSPTGLISIPFTLSQTGVLSGDIVVPPTAAGITVYSQAFLADGSAATGVTSTNGFELSLD